jgi:transposase
LCIIVLLALIRQRHPVPPVALAECQQRLLPVVPLCCCCSSVSSWQACKELLLII